MAKHNNILEHNLLSYKKRKINNNFHIDDMYFYTPLKHESRADMLSITSYTEVDRYHSLTNQRNDIFVQSSHTMKTKHDSPGRFKQIDYDVIRELIEDL